jgi:fumarylacetoacetate (FAA) hydrolase
LEGDTVKLASLPRGRDGQLVVVSDDLHRYLDATAIAPTLQNALDRWSECEAQLRKLSEQLNADDGCGRAFDEHAVSAPLPRAYQWADGSAYVNHVALVRKARGADMPASFWTDPLMYQGGSDCFLAARDPIPLADEAWGCDLEAEVCIVTDDVPIAISPADAARHIKLIGLVNDVSLRNLIPGEIAKGFGFFQSKPASALSPVFATPDSLGTAWQGAKLHQSLLVSVNGKPLGRANAGIDMTFDFARLIAHAARTRTLGAGSIIGSGTISNRDADGGPGRPIDEGGVGYSCLAEVRVVETLRHGTARTDFLKWGDRVRIEMQDTYGHSIFGAIDQVVTKPQP